MFTFLQDLEAQEELYEVMKEYCGGTSDEIVEVSTDEIVDDELPF
jgi:hypothetical protein